jgi:hypothetical protein
MKSVYLDFLRRLIIFSVILSFVAAGAALLLPKHYITPVLSYLFLFFIAITLISYYILIKAAHMKFIRFLNYYLLLTVIKLFLFIAVLVIYLMLNKNDAVPFALSFFLLYLCYTIFEVTEIISYSKVLQQK